MNAHEGVVFGPNRRNKRPSMFLIGDSATYTVLHCKVWRALKLKPRRRMTFVLADGTKVERAVAKCRLNQTPYSEAHTPVVLGEKGTG